MRQGQIITFYSYKGGVGRTMALANVAVLLARWGYRTLVVDWDLEAPGLEHFFKDFLDIEAVSENRGLVDLLTSASGEDLVPIKWRDLLLPIDFPGSKSPVHLLTAGRRSDGYFSKVRNFDVNAFYSENAGGLFIESLRNEWKNAFDFILIDSRTGVTDIGGICTIQMPDLLVLLFTATDQGFQGVLDVAHRALKGRQQLPVDRLRLLSLPIPTRFDTDKEFQTAQKWLTDFSEQLSDLYSDWLPKSVDPRSFLEATKLPYIAYFSFGERLAVIEQGLNDPAGLGYAYETLAAIIARNLESVEQVITNRAEFVRVASKLEPAATPGQPQTEVVTRDTFGSEYLLRHRDWLDSGGRKGIRLNLKNAQLAGISLKDANLRKAILSGADFSEAQLYNSDFSEADLSGANLRRADMSQAKLHHANLSNANLSEAKLDSAEFVEADLIAANLRGASLHRANLREARLEIANLTEADFTLANLTGANFDNADVRRAVFKWAELRDANLEQVRELSPEQLAGTDLSGAKLADASLIIALENFNQRSLGLNLRYSAITVVCVFAFLLEYLSNAVFQDFSPSKYSLTEVFVITFGGVGPFSGIKFYIGVPLLLSAFYIYIQFYFQQVWTDLAGMPHVFPDGKSLGKKIRPPFLRNIAESHLRSTASELPASRFQGIMSTFLFWFLVPVTILYYASALAWIYGDKGSHVVSRQLSNYFTFSIVFLFALGMASILGAAYFKSHAKRAFFSPLRR